MSKAINPTNSGIGKRAAIYVRLSDEDRAKAHSQDLSESIKNQLALASAYAAERNWTVTDIYCDDDWSGLDRDRPDFNRLLKDCEAGRIDLVLCKDMSRFSRDKIVTEEFLETKFQEWNVRFIGLTDGTDTADKGNKKSREINALVNQWYAEDISTKVRAAFKTKQNQGLFIGSYPAYGYVKSPAVKGKLEVDPEIAPVVRMIYGLYLSGNGTHGIACLLNAEGIPNPTAYKESKYPNYRNAFKKSNLGLWNKTTVKRILRNEIYIGNMVQHKSVKPHFKSKRRTALPQKAWEVVEGTHEPIIDPETFFRVQEMMNGKIRSTREGRSHIFAGKVFCKDCGCSMIKSACGKYAYLTCSTHRINSSLCSRHSVRFDELTDIVSGRIRNLLPALSADQEQLLMILTAHDDYAANLKKLKINIEDTQTQIRKVVDALTNLYKEQGQGTMHASIFNEIKEGLIRERNRMQRKLAKHRADLENVNDLSNRVQYWTAVLNGFLSFSELTRDLVVELISFVEIGEKAEGSQEIVIHYSFSDLC